MSTELDEGCKDLVRPVTVIGSQGSFRLLAELGRGGMGIVYRAWDEVLHREVALKVLRPEFAGEADRLRLVREAQLAARFHDDHMVIIHSVVDPPDNPPYLVMEYVPGPTLAELIGSERRPGPQQVAAWVAQVAGALHAAHAAGLIHRDVKPSNILIDKRTGRAKITDFGLARPQAALFRSPREGVVAGTPTYMSPEQARGDGPLDARSDIYSLGSTLYEGLTGVAAYQGAPHLVLRRLVDEDARPIRQLDDRLPRDLETICMKAMAREPARRYQTAAELGDDLTRWLLGDPILARTVARSERWLRWCRRNRRVAVLSAALLVVLLAGVAGILWQWRRAEQQAARAEVLRQAAEDSFKDAQASFHQARRAVDQFYARFYEKGVLEIPGLEKVRHEVIGEMLRYYQNFVARHRDAPALRRELAESCLKIGLLTFDSGSKADALDLLHRSLPELERLAEESPDDSEIRGKVLVCLNTLGQLEDSLGYADSALRSYRRGIEILEGLISRQPGDLVQRRRLAGINGNLANLFRMQNDFQGARQAYRAALLGQRELVRLAPSRPEFLNDLGLTYNNLALMTDDGPERHELLNQALEIRKRLVQQEPTNAFYLRNLARTYQNIGAMPDVTGTDGAWKSLEESRRLLEQVIIAQPAVTTYQADLAQLFINLATALAKGGRYNEAREHLQRARPIYERLLHASPNDLRFQEGLKLVEQGFATFEKEENASRSAPRTARVKAENTARTSGAQNR